MSDQTSHTDHPGFSMLPARRASEPGYAGLDIWICEKPSGLHFDPEKVSIYAAGKNGVDNLCLEHPWSGETRLQAVAGRLDLQDFRGHHLEGFCFGGELSVSVSNLETRLALRSTAPILLNTSGQALRPLRAASILIEEFSIVMAERHAYWEQTPGEFERRLAAAEPLKLYAAFLAEVRSRLKALPAPDDNILAALHILRLESDAAAEQVPGFELPLATLL